MNDIPTSELPIGWVVTTLNEVARWGSGGTPSRRNPLFFQGSIPWIKTGELGPKHIRGAEEHISEEAVKNSSAKVFPTGSVGIAMYGATIGKVSIWGIDASTNQACAVAQPYKGVLCNEFLYYFLLSEKRGLTEAGKGGAQPNISQGILKDWPIRLPPLNEQRRIVAKIEELFSELDDGVQSLQTAREQLKVYRQSVLKHAVEGRLTEQWREAQGASGESAADLLQRILAERRERWEAEAWQKEIEKAQKKAVKALGSTREPEAWRDVPEEEYTPFLPRNGKWKEKYTEPQPPDTEGLPELPEGWVWATVEQIGDVQLGRQRAPKHHTGPHMRPYLRVANVFEDRIDTSDVLEMNFTPEEYETYRLESGDILLNEGQSIELVGRPAMYRDEVPGACFQNTLVRFRGSKIISSDFALIRHSAPPTAQFKNKGRHRVVREDRAGSAERLSS